MVWVTKLLPVIFFCFCYDLHESKIVLGHSRTSSRMEKLVARVIVAWVHSSQTDADLRASYTLHTDANPGPTKAFGVTSNSKELSHQSWETRSRTYRSTVWFWLLSSDSFNGWEGYFSQGYSDDWFVTTKIAIHSVLRYASSVII